MNFGQAIEALKDGKKVAREGWNGWGMFIYLVAGTTVKSSSLRGAALDHVGYQGEGDDPLVTIHSHIDMKIDDGSIIVGWVPTQADMLAEDWDVVVDNSNIDDRWNAAIENARFMLEEYKKIPFGMGMFGAINIANLIGRYDSGVRTDELLEELESIQ